MTQNPFNTILTLVVAVIMALMVIYIIAPVIKNLGILLIVIGILLVVLGVWAKIDDIFFLGAAIAALGLILVVGASTYMSTLESNPVAKTVLDAGTTLVNSTKDAIP